MEIENDYLINVCLMGQREKCCRYILVDPEEGIICAKGSPVMKASLDARVDKMTAKGDNCEGWDLFRMTSNN